MPLSPGPGRVRARWIVLAILALLLVIVAACACSTLRAAALLQDATTPPADLVERVHKSELSVATRAGPTEVTYLRPWGEDGPLPAIVLCHGAVEGGARDRRLLDLANAMAVRGMVVALPHLPDLESFKIARSDAVRIADVTRWVADESGDAADGRAALAGISVGGSYALVAADDPVVRDRVSAVLAFGAYADLERLLVHWMTFSGEAPSELFDPLTEGRRLVLLGNVEHVVPPEHVAETRRRLEAILDGRAPPDDRLPPAVQEVVTAAANAEPLPQAAAERLVGMIGEDLAVLSPARAAAPSAPVYLLHADTDPVVPTADLDALAAALRSRGVDVTTHVTGIFGHVTADETPGLLASWSLLRFVAGFLDDAGL